MTGDHIVFGGYQRPAPANRCFVASAATQLRGEIRTGLIMMNAWPWSNPLVAEWDIQAPAGSTLRLQWALTDRGVRMSTTGLEFTATVEDVEGRSHELVASELPPGEEKVYQEEFLLDYPIRRVRFVHDSLGDGYVDRLWIFPEILDPDGSVREDDFTGNELEAAGARPAPE